MRFRPEPPPSAGPAPRTGVLLVNLGTPDEPTAAALRRYLAEFLSDPRVVEIPALVWQPLLRGVILTVRPSKSAAKYRSIWGPEGSPLAWWTARQASALGTTLYARGHDLVVDHAMRYGSPSVPATLDRLRAAGVTRLLVLPAYPQYAGATTGSVSDAVGRWLLGARRVPELRFVADYPEDAGYVSALAARLQQHWQQHGRGERLLLSFHGIPERTARLGDPYPDQCRATAQALQRLLGLPDAQMRVTFQSRFGRARWLEPYTEPTLRELASGGVRSVDVMCPGFVADCLETLEEIGQECRDAFLASGGERFAYVPCLNDEPEWIDALAALAERHLQGWPTQREGSR